MRHTGYGDQEGASEGGEGCATAVTGMGARKGRAKGSLRHGEAYRRYFVLPVATENETLIPMQDMLRTVRAGGTWKLVMQVPMTMLEAASTDAIEELTSTATVDAAAVATATAAAMAEAASSGDEGAAAPPTRAPAASDESSGSAASLEVLLTSTNAPLQDDAVRISQAELRHETLDEGRCTESRGIELPQISSSRPGSPQPSAGARWLCLTSPSGAYVVLPPLPPPPTHTHHDQESSEHDQLLLGPLKDSAPRPRVERVVIEALAARDDQKTVSEQAASRSLGTGLVQDRLRRGGGEITIRWGVVWWVGAGSIKGSWHRIGPGLSAGGHQRQVVEGSGQGAQVCDTIPCVSMMDQKHQREGGGVVLREVGIDDQESFILNGGSFLSSQLIGNDHSGSPPPHLEPGLHVERERLRLGDDVQRLQQGDRGAAAALGTVSCRGGPVDCP